MTSATARAIHWSEQGLVPDSVIRAGIRRLLRERLEGLAPDDIEKQIELEQAFVHDMDNSPVALVPDKANEQHYEVPAYWPEQINDIDSAEEMALQLTCEHAGIEDGMDVLELGCGWGSLTLWMAEKYQNAKILAVSNSSSQRRYIEQQADLKGFKNIRVITADMNDFGGDVRTHA